MRRTRYPLLPQLLVDDMFLGCHEFIKEYCRSNGDLTPHTSPGPHGPIWSIVSRHGEAYAVGAAGTVEHWVPTGPAELRISDSLKVSDRWVNSVCLLDHDHGAAVTADGWLVIISLAVVRRVGTGDRWTNAVAPAAGAKVITAGDHGTVRVWRWTRSSLELLSEHEIGIGWPNSIMVSTM